MNKESTRPGSRSSIMWSICPWVRVNDCSDIGKMQKVLNFQMGIKPTYHPFPRAFLGVVVIDIVVVLPERNKTIDKLLYDMQCLRRTSGINIGYRAGVIPYPDTWKILGGPAATFHSSIRKCKKKFLPLGTQHLQNFWVGGNDHHLLEFTLVSEIEIKKFLLVGLGA